MGFKGQFRFPKVQFPTVQLNIFSWNLFLHFSIFEKVLPKSIPFPICTYWGDFYAKFPEEVVTLVVSGNTYPPPKIFFSYLTIVRVVQKIPQKIQKKSLTNPKKSSTNPKNFVHKCKKIPSNKGRFYGPFWMNFQKNFVNVW